MIQRTTKVQVRQQIRRVKEQSKKCLRNGQYNRYRYASKWLKTHATLLKEDAVNV